jgi:hypothetical protein
MDDPSASKTTESAARSKRAAAPSEMPWAPFGMLLIGLWLQISSFAWRHTDAARIGVWLPALLISVVSVLSMGAPPMRWLNGVLALWLMAWTAVSAASDALTYWNGIACGLAVLVLCTVPSRSMAADYKS